MAWPVMYSIMSIQLAGLHISEEKNPSILAFTLGSCHMIAKNWLVGWNWQLIKLGAKNVSGGG